MGEPAVPVPKEQPPRKLSGDRDHPTDERLWRDPGKTRGAEGIAISGQRTEGASLYGQCGTYGIDAGLIPDQTAQNWEMTR